MITRIDLHPATSSENRHSNVMLMADGVKGSKCVYVGKVLNVPTDNGLLKRGEYFSSVEMYDNGAYNLFIHDEDHNLVAFLKARQGE